MVRGVIAESMMKEHLKDRLAAIAAFLIDVERLKLIERKAYVSDLSRRENSAEHSWHLAVGLMTVASELRLQVDLHKAIVMALVHDICEIDAGDTPAYGQARPDQHQAELKCLERLESHGVAFGVNVRELWLDTRRKSRSRVAGSRSWTA